jgi:hypothetical protein
MELMTSPTRRATFGRMRLIWILVLTVATLTGAGAVNAGNANVHGMVTKGPVTPTCRVNVACSAPAPGLPLVFLASGVEIARLKTDRAGRFDLFLAPGTYQIRTTGGRAFVGPFPRTFRVMEGRLTRLRLLIDTGIRTPIGGRPAS